RRRRDGITERRTRSRRQRRTRRVIQRRLDRLQRGHGHGTVGAVVVRRGSLGGGRSGTSLRLGGSVVGLPLLVQERRNRDRGKNADDEDHDEELDQGETLLIFGV